MEYFDKFDDSYSRLKSLIKKAQSAELYDDLSAVERELFEVYRKDVLVLVNMLESDFRKVLNAQREAIGQGVISAPVEEPAKKAAKKTIKKTTKKAKK